MSIRTIVFIQPHQTAALAALCLACCHDCLLVLSVSTVFTCQKAVMRSVAAQTALSEISCAPAVWFD